MANLYNLKPWYTRRLKLFLDFAVRHDVSPDVFTLIGIGGGALGLAGFALGLWPLVILGVLVRLAGANLDGAVARARGVSRPFGFVLNEIGDRAGDFLLFFGLALAVSPHLAWVALAVACISTMPTLVSVSGAAVGVARINGGPFGKTERCLFFCIFPFVVQWDSVVNLMLLTMALGAVLTTYVRCSRMARELSAEGAAHG